MKVKVLTPVKTELGLHQPGEVIVIADHEAIILIKDNIVMEMPDVQVDLNPEALKAEVQANAGQPAQTEAPAQPESQPAPAVETSAPVSGETASAEVTASQEQPVVSSPEAAAPVGQADAGTPVEETAQVQPEQPAGEQPAVVDNAQQTDQNTSGDSSPEGQNPAGE